jgi:glucokinase-like ROK family protein
MSWNIVEELGLGASVGGRAPRALSFHADAGRILVANLGATSITTALADLNGQILERREILNDIASGPEASLSAVETTFDELITAAGPGSPPIWGVGAGVPGPVEFASGRPIAPPIMPGWDGYPVRDRLAARYNAPAWVDNDVNVMALGELRAGTAHGEDNVLFIKIGTGIGAGLISAGQLHRGSQGAAGDVGHISVVNDPEIVCRCGNIGCLEAVASGYALARQAMQAAHDGSSPWLRAKLLESDHLGAEDINEGAMYGDPTCVRLLTNAGRFIGEMLATVVNFYNPSLIVVGGGVSTMGDRLLATIREVVYSRSLPLATRDLRITPSLLGHNVGVIGAASMVTDELFSPATLAKWVTDRSPVGRPELTEP